MMEHEVLMTSGSVEAANQRAVAEQRLGAVEQCLAVVEARLEATMELVDLCIRVKNMQAEDHKRNLEEFWFESVKFLFKEANSSFSEDSMFNFYKLTWRACFKPLMLMSALLRSLLSFNLHLNIKIGSKEWKISFW
ncbi:hypothetical protein L1987_15650 [Smallanthus sonchifolius]|uniref:Uncharacterized protein n=1 Tax=Smallanthus sonchifolius TaxID=185202 RepID=A0ACB9J8A9_9ASTR|nr:hypothetical protein L1987_15650 [Smallanthus sonchifolius]